MPVRESDSSCNAADVAGQLVASIDSCIGYIESYPKNRRLYAQLYDMLISSLPHISNKEEKKGPVSRNVSGRLGNKYYVNCFTRLGINSVQVADYSRIETDPVVRMYSTGGGWGVKAPGSAIYEIDLKSKKERVIHRNRFFMPF